MKEIYNYRHLLPRQTFKTLQGQVRAGDKEGARKGLDKIIKRQRKELKPSV